MSTQQADPSFLALLRARGLQLEWCCSAVQAPVFGYRETQEDDSVRVWTRVPGCERYVRVVIFPDGRFRAARYDRDFRKRVRRCDPKDPLGAKLASASSH